MGERVWHARLGQRVVVRRRLPDGALGDVVGHLVDVDGGGLHVVTRTGPVAVPLEHVVAGKVVPPRPVRKGAPHRVTSITDLQAVMSLHWRAAESERDGGWLLRASGGFALRANSVLPLGEPHGPVGPALDRVVAWYAARGLPARASIAAAEPGGVPDDGGPATVLLAECRRAGWDVLPGGSTLVLTAPTAGLRPLAGAALPARLTAALPERLTTALPERLTLDVAGTPDEQWLAGYRHRGRAPSPDARHLLTSAPAQAFVSVRDGGRAVGVARGSLGGGWAGLAAVEVAPSHRRRGIGAVLLAAVAEWAGQSGARSTYLQVSDTNEHALRFYARAGFAVHHRYDYYAPQP
jgi:N-acetylglutamate synthase